MADISAASLRSRARWPWQRHLHYRIIFTFGLLFLGVLVLLMIYVARVVSSMQLSQAEHGLEVQAYVAANALEDPLNGYASEFEEYERRDKRRNDDLDESDPEVESEVHEETSRQVPTTTPGSGDEPAPVRLQRIAEWYASDTHARVTIFDAHGRALADSSYAPNHVPIELDRPEIQAAVQGTEQHDVRADYFTGETSLFIAAPIQQSGQILGIVRLTQPIRNVVAPTRQVLINLAVAGLLAIALMILLGIWSGRRLVAPLRQLETAALAVGRGDFSQLAAVDTSDEIGALADAFNYMVEELSRLIERQRVFIANASHELRTPLTNIKLRSEALVDIIDEDPNLGRRYIREIDSEADRLGRLANTLLDLARMEGLPRPPVDSPVDITPALLSVVRAMRLRMRQAELSFRAHIPADLPRLAVWPDQVEVIVLNLLDNAVRYTPPGGEVHFAANADAATVGLRIHDTGLGIPLEDLPHIFDRFYRVDKARSRQSEGAGVGSGSGLGLSIVKTLVEANGGAVVVESTVGRGTTFGVTFPVP